MAIFGSAVSLPIFPNMWRMAGFAGIRYEELLQQILRAEEERLGIVPKVQAAVQGNGAGRAAIAAAAAAGR